MSCLLRRPGPLFALLLLAAMAPLTAAVGITSIVPDAGALAGGTAITITGTGFQSGATVTVGGAAATSVVVGSATSISCTTPSGVLGSQPLVVTNPDTTTASASFTYTVTPAPSINAGGIAPASGPSAGGTAITITGSGFQSGATVTVGGAAATSVVVGSATSISCTTPAGAAGAAAVVVTNPDTQLSNSNVTFAYAPAPVVTTVAPIGGPPAGGTAITITGSGFQSGATVTVGGAAATSVVVGSATSISCTTPAGAAGAAAVVVTNPDTQLSNSNVTFAYEAGPAISAVTPALGPAAGGTSITISGSNFLAGATVTVGGNAAGSMVVSATSISCTTPAGAAGPAAVVVTNPDAQSASSSFTYQGSGPTISAVSPALAPASGGTALTITGSGFLASTVTIGGAPATSVVVVSSTSITCISPPGTPGPANVVVTNSDQTSAQTGTSSNAFVYQSANQPTITQIRPVWGPVGTPITISGTNFQPNAQMLIDRVAAAGVVVVDAQTVTCTIPAGVSGFVTVTVTNPDFLSAFAVDGFNVVNGNDLSGHHCGGGHGFSTLLLAPFLAWRLLGARARRRRDIGAAAGEGARRPPAAAG